MREPHTQSHKHEKWYARTWIDTNIQMKRIYKNNNNATQWNKAAFVCLIKIYANVIG